MAFRLDSIISKLFRFRGSKAEGQFYIRPDDDNLIVGKGTDITDTSSHVLTINSTNNNLSGSFAGSFTGSSVQATEITGSDIYISGRMGIGTTTPISPPTASKLEVYGNTDDVSILVHQDDGNKTAELHLRVGSNDWELRATPDNNLRFLREGSEKVTFLGGGNVGIGAVTPQLPLDISNMGGLVIAQRNVIDAGNPTNSVALPIAMAQLSANFSVTFTVPSNGKVSIQISAFFAHAGAPGITARTAQVAIHDGSGYVYDVDGVQLDSQEFWQSEGENYMQSMEFVVTKDSSNVNLVPGASHTFNAHFQASAAATINLFYGANYLPFVMKAVTVPNTIL